MCLAVYIASDLDLPLVPWSDAKPAFHVRELDYNKGVRKQFSLANIRVAGSDAGCGCGFLKDGVVGQDLVEATENYSRLAQYIGELERKGGKVELFACWEGDQVKNAEFHHTIRSEDLIVEDFEFQERALYTIQ